MVKILSVNDNSMLPKKNIIKDFWQSFLSLDLFDKLMLIALFLIIAVTPYIIANYQIFTSEGRRRDRQIVPTPTPTPIPTPTTPLLPTLTEPPPPAGGIRAFPGAEGFGAISVGGRGGKVIEVTTLADAVPAPPGSLRACAEASGPRTCVFRVGGTIELKSGTRLEIINPYLTIAGQTAPGGGILIKGDSGIRIRTHDVIIRYLRVRLSGAGGAGNGQYYVGIVNRAYNVIIDHCSGSWTLDEGLTIWKTESPSSPDITNVTFQRCIMAEGLAGHSMGMLLGGQQPSDADPTLPSDAYLKVHEISVHHNLFVHNWDRNPQLATAGTQVSNNVAYNWGTRVGVSARKNTVDLINNYWKKGPMSGTLIFKHESTASGSVYPDPSIYMAGNIVPGTLENSAADNWPLIIKNPAEGGGPLPLSYRRYTPLAQAPNPITIQSADDAYTSVLADAGANARLDCQGKWVSNNSDAVDKRVVADVQNGTGWTSPPASPQEAGGFPVIAAGTPCTDSDSDGMPDEFENLYGFNVNDVSDNSKDADGDGYTNVEEYFNGTSLTVLVTPPPPTTLSTTPTPTPTPTPDLTITPTPTLTPIPIPTKVPTPTNIPSPTAPAASATSIPSGTIACAITSAFWDTPSNPEPAGSIVTLSVTTNNSSLCAGKQVEFKVMENDYILEGEIDDATKVNPPSVSIVGNNASSTWIAEWQNDCYGLCNPPEYYFNARIVGQFATIRSSSPMLEVVKVEPLSIIGLPNVGGNNTK